MSKMRYAFRRTLEYLDRSELRMRDSVKAISITYKSGSSEVGSRGIRRFISEHLSPVMFKNPRVQVVTDRSITVEFPRIDIYYADGEKVMMDVEFKEAKKILEDLALLTQKHKFQLEDKRDKIEYNPAYFGVHSEGRSCICEVPGQVQCPRFVPIPNVVHKWKNKNQEEQDS